jgi:hypothetical protein
MQLRRPDVAARFVSRALAAGAASAALICGAHAGADSGKTEWFGSPVSGARYGIERDAATGTKTLVGPDGRRYASVAAVVEAETAAQSQIQRLMAPELLDAMNDPERADELVDVTFIFRRQPVYDAGVAARGRADPALMAELARQHAILDRIAPLRTMLPDGRPPDVATAMRDEASLLTDEEKATLREVKEHVLALLATMRRETMAEATPAVSEDQAALAAFVGDLPGALDFGGSVTLNARSARIPARALNEIAERFPEVLRVEPVSRGGACIDTAVPSCGAGTWWNAGYNGSSSTKMGLLDCGVDGSHPALNGVIAASATFHTLAAASGSTYGDSASSTDDLQGHGTAIAGMLCSTDSTYRGIAFGGLILNAKAAYYNTAGTANMYFPDGRLAADWAITQGATSLLLNYGGAGTNNGTSEMELFFDAAAFSLGVSGVVAAKNLGPGTSTVGYPGGVFNAFTCGCFDDNGTTTLSDDFFFSASGCGPTTDGRQKPDICGSGVNITSCAFNWENGTQGDTSNDFTSFTPGVANSGTSTVGPLVCGAIALLQDYGAAAYPAGFKALLLSTTRPTLLTSSGSSTSYTAPDNCIGYGLLDCAGAYTYRGSVYEGALTSSGPRFVLLRGGALAANGRATLVWSRQVAYSGGTNIPSTYYPIQDLDLYAYSESTGAQVGSSASTVDPNEQVKVSSAVSSPVYKVYRATTPFTSSYSSEPFAVAAESTSSTALATPPTLTCTFTQLASAIAGSMDTTVTVQVANSGTVKAFAPAVTLTLPTGYTITSGSNPQTLSDIAGTSTGSATWTVHTPSTPSGVRSISAAAASTSYGETFTSATLTGSQTVDVDPPSATVSIAGGAPYTTVRDVAVALTASDVYTGVAQMRVRNAGDAWGEWTAYATSVNATLSAGEGTKTFEAEFKDGVGNSTATISDSIVYDTTPPAGTLAIGSGGGFGNSATVTLTSNVSDAGSGVANARFSNDGVAWSPWGGYSATSEWSLVSGEGPRTVYAQYRDGAGNVSATISDSIVVETSPPTGTIAIAGGAAWTNIRNATISLSATDTISGVAAVRFSDDGFFWSAWRNYAATSTWTLPGADGLKTVYAQFKDGAGNVSATTSDSIGLDTAAPTGTVVIGGDTPFTTTTSVALAVLASDALNGVAQMRFSNDFANWSAWTTYATTADWTLADGQGLKFVYVEFKDGVGNISTATWDTITVDTVPPTGTMVIADDASAVNSTDVSLDLTWADAGSGVSQVRMSNDGAAWSTWVPAQASTPWTMDAGAGQHTVFLQFRDAAGNVSATSSDSVLLDTTPPTGSFVLVHGAAYVMPWESFTADTTSSDDAGGSGVAGFRSSADGGATWSAWAPIPSDGRAVVPRPAAGADKLVTIQGEFRDAAGNVSAAATDSAFLVDDRAAGVTSIASFVGTVGVGGDMDAFRMQLVAGDKLTLKFKTKTLVKKADARVEVDVYGPDHAALATGRYPATSKTVGVAKLAAPATGEYWIVVRAAGAAADTGVAYTMSVSNASAKGSRAKKGTANPDASSTPTASVLFDAVEGLKLTGTLTVPLLDTTTEPQLLAPDGSSVPITFVRGKKGLIKISASKLVGGAGTYQLTIPASGPVKYAFALAPAKPGKLVETTTSGN